MEFHGVSWKLHGVPWDSIETASMESIEVSWNIGGVSWKLTEFLNINIGNSYISTADKDRIM